MRRTNMESMRVNVLGSTRWKWAREMGDGGWHATRNRFKSRKASQDPTTRNDLPAVRDGGKSVDDGQDGATGTTRTTK